MLRIQKILFTTDFTPCAESAFAHAVHLADRFGAEMHVLNVVRPDDEDQENPMRHYLLQEEDAVTQSDAYQHEAEESELRMIHAQVRMVSPAMGILSYADQHDVDIIVMGTHGRRGLDRLLIGSVAEEVARLATCPVLTIHGVDAEAPIDAIRRILVPIDFSEHAKLTLTYAKELALTYGAGLDLVHVIQEAVLPTAYGVEPISVAVPEVLARSREALEELVEVVPGATVPAAVHVFIGNPTRDLVAFAEEQQSDLIVIATHGLTGIKRLLLGSVTEKVVRTAPCPVFTVKSFGKSLLKRPEQPLTLDVQ